MLRGATHLLYLWVGEGFAELRCGDFRGLEKHVKQTFESSELCFPFCLYCPYLFSKVCLNFEAHYFLRKPLPLSEHSPVADTWQARCQKPDLSVLGLAGPLAAAGFAHLVHCFPVNARPTPS